MKKAHLLVQMLLVVALCACITGNVLAERLGETPLPEGQTSMLAPKAAMQVIPVNHNLTRSEVLAVASILPNTALRGSIASTYAVRPTLTPPYGAGALSAQSTLDALNALKMVRFLAGVPYANIRFGDQENLYAQHGATLLAATNQFTHNPSRPSGMSSQFYSLAYEGCNDANLSSGYTNASAAIVHAFIGDKGAKNIKAVGHRRWLLMPGASVYGIGQAGDRTSLHVMSNWPATGIAADYIAWPNGGDFPLQYFVGSEISDNITEFPWSISLGAPYGIASKSKLRITMTRSYDNRTWVFNSKTPSLANKGGKGMHLAVDNQSFGMGNTITFRPDLASLGVIRHGDAFDISVTGLSGPSIHYTVRFFDMNRPAGYVEASSVSLTQSSAIMKVGQKLTIGATLLPANSSSRQVVWTSSKSSVASVSQGGQIQAKKKGTATIVATAADNTTVYARCTVTVTGKGVALKKLTAAKTMMIENGSAKSLPLKFNPANATNKAVSFWSSNDQIASVDASGVVTGRRQGKATITATALDGGKTARCEVTVAAPVKSIATPQSTVYLGKGSLALLTASALTSDGTAAKLQFESSAKKIATVESTGIVRALKAGQATITIRADNGVKRKVTLVVGGAPIQSLSIGNLPAGNAIARGASLQLTPNFRPANARGAVYFDSSNANVIKIDASGRITALNPGTSTITLIMGSMTTSVTITVT